jgi:type I restriction enzyme S subunit
MQIKLLKQKILDLAIKGKLVPQNPKDEPASVLLEKIRKEKEKLIKAGKIKKDKTESQIFKGSDNFPYEKFPNGKIKKIDEEIPFEIPKGWEWCRLGDVNVIIRGITFPSMSKQNNIGQGIVSCLTTGSIQKEYNQKADVCVPDKYVKNSNQWLTANDIIISSANSRELVGKSCFWQDVSKKTFGGFLTVARPYRNIFPKYSFFVIQQLWLSGEFTKKSTQTTNIANINNAVLANVLFPIPPLNEQKRIVEKIESAFERITEIEKAQQDIEKFKNQIKTKVLDLAIKGKLVPQNPKDEPASVLLEKIRKEK